MYVYLYQVPVLCDDALEISLICLNCPDMYCTVELFCMLPCHKQCLTVNFVPFICSDSFIHSMFFHCMPQMMVNRTTEVRTTESFVCNIIIVFKITLFLI